MVYGLNLPKHFTTSANYLIVKYKKHIYCIGVLLQTLSLLGDATECKDIVDVGAGQGHLSRLLTFEHGFKVTTVEAAGGHAPKAQKFDRFVLQQVNVIFQGC